MPMVSDPSMWLMAARTVASSKAPYLSEAIYFLITKPMPGLKTFGVSDKGIMFYDPALCKEWTTEQAGAVLLHEVLHFLRDHAGRRESMGLERRRWNYAGDLEINDDLEAMKLVLPGEYLSPARMKLAPGLTAEEYYGLLEKKMPPPRKGSGGQASPGGKGEKGQPGGEGGEGEGEEDPAPGRGFCGSCAGRPMKGEPKSAEDTPSGAAAAQQKAQQAAKDAKAAEGEKGDGEGKGKSSGPAGDSPGSALGESDGGRSQIEIELMRDSVAATIAQAPTTGQGSVPAGLRGWAVSRLRPATVRWDTKLKRLVRKSVVNVAGHVNSTYNKIARRQAGLGFGLGRPVMAAYDAPMPNVLVVLDTSGSMGGDLSICMSEVEGILKACGARVSFAACDAALGDLKQVRTLKEAEALLVGGGGTSFCPAFRAVEAMPKAKRPHVLIYITDGYGDAPAHPVPGLETIWTLVHGNTKAPAPWGQCVVVEGRPGE